MTAPHDDERAMGSPGSLVVWLLLVVWAGVVTFFPDGNVDVWLHLRVGEEVIREGVPHVDAWSATASGRPFIAHEWLAGVLLKATADVAGGAGLVMLRVWISMLIALCLWLIAPRPLRDRPLTLLFAAIVLMLVLPRAVVRPHLFSLLFFALHVVTIEVWRERTSWLVLAWLAPLTTLWANLHGAFLLGPALLFAVGAASLLQARFSSLRGTDPDVPLRAAAAPIGVALAALLCGLVTPYGVELYAFSLEMALENAHLKALISEWRTPLSLEHRASLQTALFVAVSAVAWTAAAVRFRKVGIVDVTLLAFGTVLGVRAFRFLPYFALLAFPVLLRCLVIVHPRDDPGEKSAFVRRRQRALAAAVPGLLLVVTFLRGPGFHETLRYPFRAELAAHPAAELVSRAKKAGLKGPVLNEYELGAFLLYAAPELRPAIDARIDVYGAHLVSAWRGALHDPARAVTFVDEHDMNVAMLRPHRDAVRAALVAHGFVVLFEDEQHVLLARAP